MNRKTKIAVFISIAVLILAMALYPKIRKLLASENPSQNSRQTMSNADRSGLVVNATVLKPQSLNNMFRVTGVLLPDEEVDLTFESSGKITGIYFLEGSFVEKGSLLAKVNDEPLQAELKKTGDSTAACQGQSIPSADTAGKRCYQPGDLSGSYHTARNTHGRH